MKPMLPNGSRCILISRAGVKSSSVESKTSLRPGLVETESRPSPKRLESKSSPSPKISSPSQDRVQMREKRILFKTTYLIIDNVCDERDSISPILRKLFSIIICNDQKACAK